MMIRGFVTSGSLFVPSHGTQPLIVIDKSFPNEVYEVIRVKFAERETCSRRVGVKRS